MIWRAMRLKRSFKLSALLAVAVPALVALTAITTMADSTPTPSGTVALPGDPARGGTLFAANCATCHGGSLTGGIGPALNPIEKLPNVPNSLDAQFLIGIITNGRLPQAGDPRTTQMPAKGGNTSLTDQDVRDLAAFIIQSNLIGGQDLPLSPNELAKRTMLWVGIAIVAMLFITLLLAQYNMRWIARRAAARRK
jgi:mono/diheme cytochrome c family protein